MNDTQSGNGTSRTRRWTLAGIAAASTAAVVGGLAVHRHANAMGGPGMHGHGMGGGFGPWGHQGFGADPETANRRIEAMVSWMLADIDATAEQKAKIAAIVKKTSGELLPMRKQHMEARRQSIALLSAATIDRAKLEKLRAEQLQLGESTSKLLLQSMIEGAEVLTPEQRTKIAAKWQRPVSPRTEAPRS